MSGVGSTVTAMPSEYPLDTAERAVLALPDDASAAVLGAPGTGKTRTGVELVAERITSGRFAADEVLLLAPRRPQAARLRDRLLLAVGRPTSGPLARTPASLAFDIARRSAAAEGREAPVLLAGGEQDTLLGQLLEEPTAAWPERLGSEVRGVRAFRNELRELFARCRERGLEPGDLVRLGAERGRDDWVAAGTLWAEYLDVVAVLHPNAFDSVELAALAAAAVQRGAGGEVADRLRLLVVDDLQDAGEATVGLLAALAARGTAVVAFGDPDVAADSFRGGEPDLLGRFGERLRLPHAARLRLDTVHRHPATIREFVAGVTERIGTALAGAQRSAVAPDGGHPVTALAATGAGDAAVRIAHLLRDRHLQAGVPFADQAVLVRSGALAEPLARALEIAGVPAVVATTGLPPSADRAARALLDVVATAIGQVPLTPDRAVELLTGPFCGLDGLALRRLRLALRVEELAGDGARSSGALLVEALEAPGRLATVESGIGRRAARFAGVLAEVRAANENGASAEELLWLVWAAGGLAGPWRERALSAGIAAAEANRDLDGVVALFTAAARAAERGPTDPAGRFLAAQLAADVQDDTLAPRGLRDGVLVTTPSAAVGAEFDTVVIAGLQDGVWPNLRPRGSLLGLPELVAVLAAPPGTPVVVGDERRSVLSDELRLFALAASRAKRMLVLAAVANDDESPSVLFGLAEGPTPDASAESPNALRPLVALLRRTVVTGTEVERVRAAGALARLAGADVGGASPDQWWGLAAPSTVEPLVPDPLASVAVSPSKLERFEDSPLDWFVERVAGGEPLLAAAIGTVIHWVLETATVPDESLLLTALEGRWRELDFEAGWLEARERRLAARMIGAVSAYLTARERERWRLLGGETKFEFPVGRAIVRGMIDRVELDPDGRVHVVDLKTGATRVAAADVPTHAQLGVYQLAVLEGAVEGVDPAADRGGAALLYVRQKGAEPFKLIPQAAVDDDAAEAMRVRIRAAAEGMAAATFEGLLEPEQRHGASTFRPMLLRIPEVCGG